MTVRDKGIAERKSVEGLVRIRSLTGFVACVDALGGDPLGMLARLGFDPARLDTPDGWMPFAVTLRAFELASRELDEPAFGFRLSRARDLSFLGPIMLAARYSPDLGSAVRCVSRYFGIQNTAVRTEMVTADGTVLRSYHMARPLRRTADQWVEETLATFGRLLEHLAGRPIPVSRILMRHPPNRSPACYAEQYGVEVLFEQAIDGLEFPADVLACPLPNHDREVHRFVAEILDASVPAASSDVEAATRRLLETLIPVNQGRIGVVAGHLGLHPRTLQRRLRELGYTFSELLEDQKRAMAERLLRRGDLPLVEVAACLGYAEQSAFNHAFNRWHTLSPSEWRRRFRPGVDGR